MKVKTILLAVAVPAAFLLNGCASKITNLTNRQVPENPSGIYTLSMKTSIDAKNIIPGTFEPQVVVDGEVRPMRPSGIGEDIFDFEYRMPPNRDKARYYYQVVWKQPARDGERERIEISDIHEIKIIDRYVLQIESQRGPVGSEIAIVGRGFSEADQVVFGGYEASTRYYSPTSISFVVPPVNAGEAYPVEVHSGNNVYFGGTFFVDEASFSVSPQRITVDSGQRTLVTIAIPNAAPEGGFLVDVTTNVPKSVIMPEVIIPEGKRAIAIPMEGGQPGSGTLYISAPGFEEVSVPVSVR